MYWNAPKTNKQLTMHTSSTAICACHSFQRDNFFEDIEPPKTTFGGFALYGFR